RVFDSCLERAMEDCCLADDRAIADDQGAFAAIVAKMLRIEADVRSGADPALFSDDRVPAKHAMCADGRAGAARHLAFYDGIRPDGHIIGELSGRIDDRGWMNLRHGCFIYRRCKGPRPPEGALPVAHPQKHRVAPQRQRVETPASRLFSTLYGES